MRPLDSLSQPELRTQILLSPTEGHPSAGTMTVSDSLLDSEPGTRRDAARAWRVRLRPGAGPGGGPAPCPGPGAGKPQRQCHSESVSRSQGPPAY
jgi:hypothetical protein